MIRIDVSGAKAYIRFCDTLTVGMVGATAEFHFDDGWNGLTKTAVFRQGDVTRDVVNVGSEVTIPPEVFAVPGIPIQIGVYGTNADGTVVIPTIWVKTANLKPGADPSGDESTEPSLPVWAQLAAELGKLKEMMPAVDAEGGDWSAAEGETGHILNRTHYKEETPAVVLYDGSSTFATELGSITGIDTTQVTEGGTYAVSWNGTAYSCKAILYGSMLLGNASLLGSGDDTGEPFCLEVLSDTSAYIYKNTSTAETVTIKVEIPGEVTYHKLDNNYLALDWLPVRKETQLAAEKIVTNDANNGFPDLNYTMVEDGQTLAVYMDGERYEVTVSQIDDESDGRYAAAVGPDSLFYLMMVSTKTIVGLIEGEHVMSVWSLDGYNKLPKEYLPDDIGNLDEEAVKEIVAEYNTENPLAETDPTVPAWAKAATKPTYTAAEVGAQIADFVVTFEQNEPYTADKTFEEVKAAYEAGATIVGVMGGQRYEMCSDGGGEGFGFINRVTINANYKTIWLWEGDYVTFRSDSLDISHPVTSVNGKTGAVSLTASDVGALPDTTAIPTVPTNVSAFTNDAGYAKTTDIPSGIMIVTVADEVADISADDAIAHIKNGGSVGVLKGTLYLSPTDVFEDYMLFSHIAILGNSTLETVYQYSGNKFAVLSTENHLQQALTINGTKYDGSAPVTIDIAGGEVTDEQIAAAVEEYLTENPADVPSTLPNPNALTFTGAVEATYDGSEAVSVEIPEGIEKVSAWQLVWEHTATAEDAELSSFEITSAEYPDIVDAKAVVLRLTHSTAPTSNMYRRLKINGTEYCRTQNNNLGNMYFAYVAPNGMVLCGTKASTAGGTGGLQTDFGLAVTISGANVLAPAILTEPITRICLDSWTAGVLLEGSTICLYIYK